jgi:hypothetical protein
MGIARGTLVFLVALVLSASDSNIAGNWNARFTGGVGYTTVADADLQFKVDGENLTGVVRVGNGFPGKAPISEGKINGDHISFTAIGKNTAMGAIITMKFTGIVHGDELDLAMTMSGDDGSESPGETDFKGKRVGD